MKRTTTYTLAGAALLPLLLLGQLSRTARTEPVASPAPLSYARQEGSLMTPTSSVTLRDAPSGQELGQAAPGALLSILARDRGWVRVRLEGWVQDDQLIPADSSLRMSPSAADVRADPNGMRGRLVRWEMEFISLQRADPLRRDLRPEEWYILARGPGSENAISYLVIPDHMRSAAEGISPLSRIIVTARVRVGRSQPVGVPILDVESMARR